ncbi:MAG: 50S ribosomal protein L33 [Alphaproteobacteria bacterium]
MANKKETIFVKMANKETGTYYAMKKNPKSENTKGKMKMRKYDKKLRKHVTFKETKMPK